MRPKRAFSCPSLAPFFQQRIYKCAICYARANCQSLDPAVMYFHGMTRSLELAHLTYENGRTYEDYLGLRGLERQSWGIQCNSARRGFEQRQAWKDRAAI